MGNTLEGVKPGDKLLVGRGHYRHLSTVERVTDTMVICRHNARYRKKDGRLIGSAGFSVRWARIPDPEELAGMAMNDRIATARVRLAKFLVTPENIDAVERLVGVEP